MSRARTLVAVPDGASAAEVAAIAAVVAALEQERARAAAAGGDGERSGLDAWVQASRLTARRAGMPRGSWRLAGRVGRRARA